MKIKDSQHQDSVIDLTILINDDELVDRFGNDRTAQISGLSDEARNHIEENYDDPFDDLAPDGLHIHFVQNVSGHGADHLVGVNEAKGTECIRC